MKNQQEELEIWKKLPFRVFYLEKTEEKQKNAKHCHKECLEVYYVRRGKLTFFIHEKCFLLHDGETMVINSNEAYSVTAEPVSDVLVLQIPDSILKDYKNKEGEYLFRNQNREMENTMSSILDSMAEAFEKKEFAYEFEVQAIFYQLLHQLLKGYSMADNKSEETARCISQNRLTEILNYMKENYTEEITLESLAEEFGFSPVYLSKMFKKYGDMNFKQTLQKIRLEHAYHDLLNSNMSISDIARKSGFPNVKSLTTAFKQRYYCLPSAYRKNEAEAMDSKTTI